jgi:plasmid stabilization system protein ParE
MRVVFTDEALRDLDEILSFIAVNHPTISSSFQQRLRTVLRRIGTWPKSAEEVKQRPGVRVVPLVRYPYKIFYQTTSNVVEVLHLHHAARQPPWSEIGPREG